MVCRVFRCLKLHSDNKDSYPKIMATTKPIPVDVVRHILLYLPIKSLVRFRVVEKAWDALMSEDSFVEHYLIRHVLAEDHDSIIVHKDQISMLFPDKESIICPSSDSLQVVGSVRGIVCLRHGLKYALWNPALHKFVEFSVPAMDFLGTLNKPFLDLTCPKIVGLGFDPENKEYKVIVCHRLDRSTTLGTVYLPSTSTWEKFDIPDYLLNPDTSFDDDSLDRTSPCVIANCCPYWVNVSTKSSDDPEVFQHLQVVKFDVGVNKFKSLPLFRYPLFGAAAHQFMKLKDSPTVLRCEFDNVKSDVKVGVYCLDREDDLGVWILKYNLGPITLDGNVNDLRWYWLQGFRHGAEIVLQHTHRFRFIGDPRIIKEPRKYLLYDVESSTRKFLQGTTSGELRSCYSYTPTLVLLPGMRSVYSYDSTIGSWPVFPWRLIHSLEFLKNRGD